MKQIEQSLFSNGNGTGFEWEQVSVNHDSRVTKMCYRQTMLVLGLTLLLFVPTASAWGQIGGGIGGQRGVGSARGIGGVRGLSSPRGGLDFRSNPIANPPPSLTPHEVFHPQGSLSSGQVLNPAPSLRRPRSAGSVPTLRQPGATAGSVYRAAQLSNTVPTGRQPVISTPVGQRLQQSASTLERRLTQVAHDKGWEEYLSCATLREVQRSSTQPRNTQRRELQTLLERYESVAAEKKYKIVSRLPEFPSLFGRRHRHYLCRLSCHPTATRICPRECKDPGRFPTDCGSEV